MNRTKEMMQAMIEAIDSVLNEPAKPKKNGFVLLVFPFDAPEGARTNYGSNARREDIVVAMKEIVARFEGQPHQSGRA